MAEHLAVNERVLGSSPSRGAIHKNILINQYLFDLSEGRKYNLIKLVIQIY